MHFVVFVQTNKNGEQNPKFIDTIAPKNSHTSIRLYVMYHSFIHLVLILTVIEIYSKEIYNAFRQIMPR